VPPESPQPGEHPTTDPDATREMPRYAPEQSPWSRQYAGPVPAPPPAPSWPPASYPPPNATFPPASAQGWPSASQQEGWPSQRSRRGLWTGLTLVGIAIVATLIAVLVSSTSSGSSGKSGSSASGGTRLPIPAPSIAPSPAPSLPGPSSPSSPQSPLPSLGGVATPPGLLAIDYHAYSLTTLAPSDIALGPAELVQFKKYGLSRVVGLRAITLGPTNGSGDDYDADINILKFSSPAAAAAELNYSNSQNKKQASTIALPGLPAATAFVNKGDSSTGISIGAFTTVGRYQVVVILSGLSANVPTNARVVAAEAARVLRAVLPDAATIIPPASSGGTEPNIPGFPTPSPTGTHA